MTLSNSILLGLLTALLVGSFAWDQQDSNMNVNPVSQYIASQGHSQLYGPAF